MTHPRLARRHARSLIATLRHDVLSATARPDHHALSEIAGGHRTHSVASRMRDAPDMRLAQHPPGNVGEVLVRPEIHGLGQRAARPDRLRGDRRRFAADAIPRPGRPSTVPEQQPALGTVGSIQR